MRSVVYKDAAADMSPALDSARRNRPHLDRMQALLFCRELQGSVAPSIFYSTRDFCCPVEMIRPAIDGTSVVALEDDSGLC